MERHDNLSRRERNAGHAWTLEQATDRAAVIEDFLLSVLDYDESQLRYELRHCAALCSDDVLAAVLAAHSRGEY